MSHDCLFVHCMCLLGSFIYIKSEPLYWYRPASHYTYLTIIGVARPRVDPGYTGSQAEVHSDK